MKQLFYGVAALLIFLATLAQAEPAATAQFPVPFTFTGLQLFLDAHPEVTTVDQFLEMLPLDYRKYYALVHTSRSLQGASMDKPRTIVMTTQAGLTFTFTGDAEQTRGKVVEFNLFHPETRSYEFRELSFAQDRPELSQSNPPLCQGCHGQDPRPIWEPYPFWPGAFGECRAGGSSCDSRATVAQETAFYAHMSELPRYRSLVPFDQTSIGKSSPAGDYTHANFDLMRIFYVSNSQRLTRILQETPYYSAYKYAIAGALLCYGQDANAENFLTTYLPQALANAHLQNFRPEYRHDSEPGAYLFWDYLFESRGISTSAWPTQFGKLNSHSGTRYSDGETPGSPKFYSGNTRYMVYWLLQNDPDLATLIGGDYSTIEQETSGLPESEFPIKLTYSFDINEAACKTLAATSQKVMSQLLATTSPEKIITASQAGGDNIRPAGAILQECAGCHGSGGSAPQIPFDDGKALTQQLREDATLLKRISTRLNSSDDSRVMPPGAPLSPAEREGVLAFLQDLTRG